MYSDYIKLEERSTLRQFSFGLSEVLFEIRPCANLLTFLLLQVFLKKVWKMYNVPNLLVHISKMVQEKSSSSSL